MAKVDLGVEHGTACLYPHFNTEIFHNMLRGWYLSSLLIEIKKQVWWLTSTVLTLERLRQNHHEFEESPGSIVPG